MLSLDIRCIFSSHLNRKINSFPFFCCLQMDSGLTKNMAHTSGALMWAKMLRERIQTPWEKIRLLFDMSVKTPDYFQ